jgi:hypothetical protein
MSDWLERELARDLAPVVAPPMLAIRLGLAPAQRWVFPRMALAVAAAVVLVIGGAYAAGRTAALDLRLEAGVDVAAEDSPLSAARPNRCDGGAARPLRVTAPKATVLLAHAVPAGETPGRAPNASSDAGCHLCHNL